MNDRRPPRFLVVALGCALVPLAAFADPPTRGSPPAVGKPSESSGDPSGARRNRGAKIAVGKGYVLIDAPTPVGLVPSKTLSQQQRSDNFETLAEAIGKYFAMFAIKGIRNWPDIVASYRQRLGGARSIEDFYLLLYQFVNELQDSHSGLQNWRPRQLDASPHLGIEPFGQRAVVTGVQAGSEAEQEGVRPGDEVLQIDGAPVEARLSQLQAYLRRLSSRRANQRQAYASLLSGPEGTTVTVQLRSPQRQLYEASLRRTRGRWFLSPSQRSYSFAVQRLRRVHYGIHPSGLGYIYVSTFQDAQTVGRQFDAALETMRHTPGLIIDLRGNMGGMGSAHQQMVGRLLSEPTVLAISHAKDPLSPERLVRRAIEVSPCGTWQYLNPIALLLDEDTGSAADLFACYLRSSGHVVGVGRATHGNLSGQAAFVVLPCNLVVRISPAFICDPRGVPIEGNGNVPEIGVERTVDDLLAGRDAALEKAVGFLQGTAEKIARGVPQGIAARESPAAAAESPQITHREALGLYRDEAEIMFRQFLDPSPWQALTAEKKAAHEDRWLAKLATGEDQEQIEAINGLAAIGSRKAVDGLLNVATQQSRQGERARWMAVRALGDRQHPL